MTEAAPSLRRFIRRAVEGMQRPPLFEADDGGTWVLKLSSLDRDFPVAELVAAHLARALDVPMPAFAVLDVPPALTAVFAATGDPDLAEFAASFDELGGQVFGSRWLDGVVQKWTPALRPHVDQADVLLTRVSPATLMPPR